MHEIIKPSPHLLKDVISRFGHKPALMYKSLDGKYEKTTYSELDKNVGSLGSGLVNLGLERKNIAIVSENGPIWPTSEYAINSSGGVFVPVYSNRPHEYVEYVLKDSGASGIVVSGKGEFDKIKNLRNLLPELKFIFTMDGDRDIKNGIIPISEVMSLGKGGDFQKLDKIYKLLSLDDIAKIIYTSGTTGEPKGVVLDQMAITYNALASIERMGFNEHDFSLSFLPLAHSFESNNQNVILLSGGTVAYSSRESILEDMKVIKPTAVTGVPVMFEKIYSKFPDFSKKALNDYITDIKNGENSNLITRAKVGITKYILKKKTGGNMRFFISGGSPLNPKLSEYFENIIPILEGYGLTENSPVVSVNCLEDIVHGYVGKALSLVIHDENGKEVGPIKVKVKNKRLYVKGPSVMKGYLNKPKETKEAFSDGWLDTGDVAEIKNDNIKIKWREGFLNLSGGETVPIGKIETTIQKYLPDFDIVVAGDRKPYVSALLFPKDGTTINIKNVKKAMRDVKDIGDLSSHEKPRRFKIMEFSLKPSEKTPTLKPMRRKILENYEEAVKYLYSRELEI